MFTYVNQTDFDLCATFDAIGYSNAPKAQFPPNITGPHFIEQHGFTADGSAFGFGWTFRVLDAQSNMIAFGRHTFEILADDDGNAIVSSFEKAAGPNLDVPGNAAAWAIALEESLDAGVLGLSCLEAVYAETGDLQPADVESKCKQEPQ